MGDVIARVELPRRRFTVEEYYRMGEAGILGPEDRVELIEGEIIQMAPIGNRHAACVARLNRVLARALEDRALLWPQNHVHLLRDTVPQPDIALLRPRSDDYSREAARPEDILLLIEVADTTYRYDRGVKLPLYARAGVVEMWIVDLSHDVVEVHRQPGRRGYASAQRIERGGTIAPSSFPDVAVVLGDVLPPA